MNVLHKTKVLFTGLSSRSQMVVKNAAGSFLIKAGSMLVDFIRVPVMLSFLDASHYGVYVTIVSIVAWTHQFDFGLGTGLRFQLTKAISLNNVERGKQLVSTAYISLAAIMLFVLTLCLPIVFSLDWLRVLNCDFVGIKELTICVCIVLAVCVLQYVLELISVVLQADQRSAISSVFKPIANLVALIAIFVLKPFYHNSLFIACLALTIPILLVLFFANVWSFCKNYKKIAPSFQHFRKDCLKDIYSLGLKYFASQFSSLIVFSTASFLLSHYVNPMEAAVYNTAWAYFGIVVAFNAMILQPMIAAVTDASVKNEMAWVKNMFKKIRFYSLGLSLLEILLLSISPIFFNLWLGERLTIPFSLSIVMTIYFILNVWVNPYNNFVGGMGKLDVSALLSLFKILIFFPVAISLVKLWGSIGLVLTIILVNTLPNLILGIIQYNMIINNRAKGIWDK